MTRAMKYGCNIFQKITICLRKLDDFNIADMDSQVLG